MKSIASFWIWVPLLPVVNVVNGWLARSLTFSSRSFLHGSARVTTTVLRSSTGSAKNVGDLSLRDEKDEFPLPRVPSRRHGDDAFVVQYLDADEGIYNREISEVLLGETWDLSVPQQNKWQTPLPQQMLDTFISQGPIAGANCTRLTHLDFEYMRDNFRSWSQRIENFHGYDPTKLKEEEDGDLANKASRLLDFLRLADQAYTQDDWKHLQELGYQQRLYDPISTVPNPPKTYWDPNYQTDPGYPIPVLVTVQVPQNSSIIQRKIPLINNTNDKTILLELQALSGNASFYKVLPSQESATFLAIGTKDNTNHFYTARLVLFVVQSLGQAIDAGYVSECPCYDNIWDRYQQQQDEVEGVVVLDTQNDNDFQNVARQLTREIDRLAEWQVEQGRVHYHPHSNGIVRDLVHPSMFAYQDKDQHEDATATTKDCFGRRYETNTTLRMLPTNVQITHEEERQEYYYDVMFENYINNLVPREEHEGLYQALQKLLALCFPAMERVYSYIQAIEPLLQNDVGTSNRAGVPHLPIPYETIGGQLQVIPKIVDYEFTTTSTTRETGAWHVEGIPQEHIVLTCLYILDREEAIQGGDIEFQRPLLSDELGYGYDNQKQYPHAKIYHLLDDDSHSTRKDTISGRQPLGTVATPKGRLIVFPNSHIHRLTELFATTNKEAEGAKRRVVIFFVVDPKRRTISTSDIGAQQDWAGGTMSLEEAKVNQKTFMEERVSSKQNWNLRTVSLCEH